MKIKKKNVKKITFWQLPIGITDNYIMLTKIKSLDMRVCHKYHLQITKVKCLEVKADGLHC